MPIRDIFRPKPVRDILAASLADARREAHEHECAAEHHSALADMYAARVSRLTARLAASDGRKVVPFAARDASE